MIITINLSDVETKALAYIAVDPQDWANNVIRHRANLAIEEIYQLETQRLIDEGAESISTNRTEVVMNSLIKSAAERNADMIAEMEAMNAAMTPLVTEE